jgi:hypothetical protein
VYVFPGGGVAFVLTPDDHQKAQEDALSSHCKEVVSVLVKTDVLMEMARNLDQLHKWRMRVRAEAV